MAELLTRTYTYRSNPGAASGTCEIPLSLFTAAGDTRPITQILSVTVRHNRYHDTTSSVGYTAKLIFGNGAETLLSAKTSKRGETWHTIENTFSVMPSAGDFTEPNVTLSISPDTKTNRVYWRTANTGAWVEVTITYYSSEFKPNISDVKIYRASEIGSVSDSGIYLTFQAKLSVADAGSSGSGVLKIYEVTSGTVVFSKTGIAGSTGGITITAAPISGYTLPISDAKYFKIVFEYTAYTSTGFISTETMEYAAIYIDRVFTNFHLAGVSTGGACFGGFSTSTEGNPKLESRYPAHFYDTAYFHGGVDGLMDYSASEVKTGGKWIDGKPIYRAVIEVGAKSGNTHAVDVSAFGIKTYISVRGMFYAAADYGDGYVFPAPAATTNSSYNIQLEAASRTRIEIKTTSRTWQSGFLIIEYTKVEG